MASNPKNVIIAGGSLAGLMSGLMLKRLGHNVRIFETRPHLLNDEGAGIVFGEDSQQYFQKFVKTDRDLWVTSHVRQTLDRNGKVLHQEKYGQRMVSWDLLYYLLRANFDGLKSDYWEVPEHQSGEGRSSYEYGSTVVGVKEAESGVDVECKDKDGQKKTEIADLLIAADGASSAVRAVFLPDIKRKYVGYVAWRGTVLESDASQYVKDSFVDHFSFYHGPGIQILSYLIPGKNGSLEPGKRLINWVWYLNYEEGSPEFNDLFTDTKGNNHAFTMPIGAIKPELCQKLKEHAGEVLAPQFAQIVQETKYPFVQAITDVLSPEVSFLNGKVLLVGDAVAGFRPHTAASTSQAAFDALLLEELFTGRRNMDHTEADILHYAGHLSKSGIQMGNRSQFQSLKVHRGLESKGVGKSGEE